MGQEFIEEFSVIGLNHATAPVNIREAVSAKPGEAAGLCAAACRQAGLGELVVLSTCSRFELYGTMSEEGRACAIAWLKLRAGRDLGDSLYSLSGLPAIQHLFRVTAGLDSWILGETEILGQVKTAYQAACAQKTAGRAAHLAFQRALSTGKRARNETGIVGGIASVGGAAAVLARKIFTDLKDRRILVFGAGTMAASTVRHLCSKGVSGVWVANRSLENARVLARELGGEAMDLERGMERLSEADVAVFSTSAPGFMLDARAARELSARRGGKPLFLIDLGVPRNVDPAVAHEKDVFLYDIDDLREVVRQSLSSREAELACAQALVNAESADCWQRITHPLQAPSPLSAARPPALAVS